MSKRNIHPSVWGCLGRAGLALAVSWLSTSGCTGRHQNDMPPLTSRPGALDGNMELGLARIISGLQGRNTRSNVLFFSDEKNANEVRARDVSMKSLVSLLGSQPATACVHCLVVDVVQIGPGLGYYGNAKFFEAKGIAENDKTRMLKLGFVELSALQWKELSLLAEDAAACPMQTPSVLIDTWDALIVSYYNGKDWTVGAWFKVNDAGVYRFPMRSDLVLFELLSKVWALQKGERKCGLEVYWGNPFLDRDERRYAEGCLRQGKEWSIFGRR